MAEVSIKSVLLGLDVSCFDSVSEKSFSTKLNATIYGRVNDHYVAPPMIMISFLCNPSDLFKKRRKKRHFKKLPHTRNKIQN